MIIRQLRTKIERDPAHPRHILTEPWLGHRFQRSPRKIWAYKTGASANRMNRVEIEIQFQHIDARFAEEAELPSFYVFVN